MSGVVASPSRIEPVPVVAVYLRVSEGEQHEENQRPDIERLLAARFPGAEVVWYIEKHSATRGKRPVFERLLANARAGRFSALVIWKLDRFGRSLVRNLNDIVELDRLGVCLVSVCEPWLDTTGPMRHMLVANYSWFAELESQNISLRVHTGLARVRDKGGATGSVCFGLELVRDEHDDVARPVIAEAARPALIRLGESLAACRSLRGAALRINAESAGALRLDKNTVRRVLTDETLRKLGAWPPDLLARIDAALEASEARRTPGGAATPVHLASAFLACASCGGGLTVKQGGGSRPRYMCSKCAAKGPAACAGVGTRAKPAVERALIDIVRPAIDGAIKARALQLVREKLAAAPDAMPERDAVAAALEEAEREGARLAQAVAKGGKLDALVEALKANDAAKTKLRARLARLDASPVASLDARRRLAAIEEKLGDLAKVLDEGGLAARPAVQAVLQGRRLRVIPVIVDGVKRWQISGWIPANYVARLDGDGNDGAEGERPRSPRRD